MSAANSRAAAILFIMLSEEGQRRYEQQLPHSDITEIEFEVLWHQLDDVFLMKRNVTVDRDSFFTRKQFENGTMEHFHAALTALAAKYHLRDLETDLVGDLFIINMSNLELQRNFARK